MGKLTISMAIFNSFLYAYQRVYIHQLMWVKQGHKHTYDWMVNIPAIKMVTADGKHDNIFTHMN